MYILYIFRQLIAISHAHLTLRDDLCILSDRPAVFGVGIFYINFSNVARFTKTVLINTLCGFVFPKTDTMSGIQNKISIWKEV